MTKKREDMKNIYFIEAKSPSAHIFSKTTLPRLGAILLATILKEKGYNTKVFIEDISIPDWRQLEDADMICISSITSTAPRAYQIAQRFSKLNIPIVLGGPHPTFMPEEGLTYADYIIRGEGEETITELVEHLEKDLPLNGIKGLSFKRPEGSIIHNPGREFLHDLDAAPIPDLSLVYNWNKIRVVPIATSRGCPFACRFCSVIQMFGRRYRFKSIERVIEEVKAIASEKVHIFFVDDNFAANKERTKELLQAIIDNNLKIEWSAQVRIDIAKDTELLRLMKATNCFSVYIGLESINPETLALYNKGQSLEDIDKAIRLIKAHSIGIHGMFVLGSDMDDIQTIRETEGFAKRLNIDSVQFLMLTPLPGTPVFEELKSQGRLIHTDWSRYDAHHAVFEPKHMTAFELHIETLKAMAKFYSWGLILRNLWRFDKYYTFIGLYGKRSVKKGLSTSRRYLENLKEMIISRFDRKTDSLRENFLKKHETTKSVILNTSCLDKAELKFFLTFFKKLGKEIILNKETLNIHNKNILSITPFVKRIHDRKLAGTEYLKEFYDKNKAILRSVKVVNLKSISLYKACVDIGLLLNINLKKIRKAYEKALKEIGGNVFECDTVIIMVKEG